ncbi:S41 family peptidase [Catalinimonas sp. 4WD22]|uniref:S41 family peptidase n=1 Tax=Catalinimonas locisalis TaxID=3133978 RepID=UPI003100B25D
MKPQLLALCLLFLILTSCSEDEPNPEQLKAEEHLNEVLDIMQTNSLRRNEIDWTDFRNQVLTRINGIASMSDIYPGISTALTLLEDNHSSYAKPDGGFIYGERTIGCEFPNISEPSLPQHIGYVKVSGYSGASNDAEGLSYAQGLRDQIKSDDSPEIMGWIVDLRSMGGGNMWPMIAGLGPILGEGTAGYFIDPDGLESSWGFQNNASVYNGNKVTSLSSYALEVPDPKVAVLLNNGVSSSGEVVAISFIGRANTRSFGQTTCGLSTANSTYNLSDNATLYLTTAYLADRNKKTYGMPVEPDLIVEDGDIIQEAIMWIEND